MAADLRDTSASQDSDTESLSETGRRTLRYVKNAELLVVDGSLGGVAAAPFLDGAISNLHIHTKILPCTATHSCTRVGNRESPLERRLSGRQAAARKTL